MNSPCQPVYRRRAHRPTLATALAWEQRNLSPLSGALRANQRRVGECRVIGPYAEGGKFRLVAFMPERKSVWCQTRQEAEALKLAIKRTIADHATRTVGEALDEYLLHMHKTGIKASTLTALSYKLGRFLPRDLSLGSFTHEVAAKLYRDETERVGRFGPISACTHRMLLRSTKAFFCYLVEERKYLPTNPWDKVKPVGRVNVGKAQLTIDEARKLNAWLIMRADSGDEGATAVLMQLVLGLRSSEVLQRRVRDLDDGGHLLRVPEGKTQNARRLLRIESEPLRALLQRQTQGKGTEDFLFGHGKPLHTDYL